jgi:hypothetical protein
MRKDLFKGVILGAIVSTIMLMATSVLAGTGIGAVFNLGKTNQVNALSTLKGNSGKNLQITNTGTGKGLGITVGAGKAPIAVNAAAGKANNLNADKIDGYDSAALQKTCTDGAFLASGYVEDSAVAATFGTGGLDNVYSCLGTVEIRRDSAGLYSLRFANATDGLFATFTPRAILTARSGDNNVANFFTYIESGYVLGQVATIDPSTGSYVDDDFAFVITDLDCSGIICSLVLKPEHQGAGVNASTKEKAPRTAK